MSGELKYWIVIVFLVVGFFAVPWNIQLEVDIFCWLRKKYRVRRRKKIYANTNNIRKQYKEHNGTAVIRNKYLLRPGWHTPSHSMHDRRPDRPLRSIDV